MTVRVQLTMRFDLEVSILPSEEALNAAMQRAETAAARVFVNGDAGGKQHIEVEPSDHPVPKTCETVDVLSGHVSATVRKKKR